MIRIDLTALTVAARQTIRDDLREGNFEGPFWQAVDVACTRGVADAPVPETASAAREWKREAAVLSRALFDNAEIIPSAELAASIFNKLAADLDDHVRQLDEAAYLGSEAGLKYGFPSGKGEIVPEDDEDGQEDEGGQA